MEYTQHTVIRTIYTRITIQEGLKHALPRRLDEGQLSDPGQTYTLETTSMQTKSMLDARA